MFSNLFVYCCSKSTKWLYTPFVRYECHSHLLPRQYVPQLCQRIPIMVKSNLVWKRGRLHHKSGDGRLSATVYAVANLYTYSALVFQYLHIKVQAWEVVNLSVLLGAVSASAPPCLGLTNKACCLTHEANSWVSMSPLSSKAHNFSSVFSALKSTTSTSRSLVNGLNQQHQLNAATKAQSAQLASRSIKGSLYDREHFALTELGFFTECFY